MPEHDASSARAVADAAGALRAAWNLGSTPISSLVVLLEDAGIRMVALPDAMEFDACAFLIDGSPEPKPMIVYNDDLPGEYQRMAIARELAFFLLDGLTDLRLARHFASAFLLPSQMARYYLGSSREEVELVEIHSIKQICGMSMKAIIARAAGLGIIERETAEEWINLFDEMEWNDVEPGDAYPPEITQRSLRLAIRVMIENEDIGRFETASLLGMTEEELASVLMLGQEAATDEALSSDPDLLTDEVMSQLEEANQ